MNRSNNFLIDLFILNWSRRLFHNPIDHAWFLSNFRLILRNFKAGQIIRSFNNLVYKLLLSRFRVCKSLDRLICLGNIALLKLTFFLWLRFRLLIKWRFKGENRVIKINFITKQVEDYTAALGRLIESVRIVLEAFFVPFIAIPVFIRRLIRIRCRINIFQLYGIIWVGKWLLSLHIVDLYSTRIDMGFVQFLMLGCTLVKWC